MRLLSNVIVAVHAALLHTTDHRAVQEYKSYKNYDNFFGNMLKKMIKEMAGEANLNQASSEDLWDCLWTCAFKAWSLDKRERQLLPSDEKRRKPVCNQAWWGFYIDDDEFDTLRTEVEARFLSFGEYKEQ